MDRPRASSFRDARPFALGYPEAITQPLPSLKSWVIDRLIRIRNHSDFPIPIFKRYMQAVRRFHGYKHTKGAAGVQEELLYFGATDWAFLKQHSLQAIVTKC